MSNIKHKIDQLISKLEELRKSAREADHGSTEKLSILPNGQWTLSKTYNPSSQSQDRIREKASEEFKSRMKDVINFFHRKQQPIPSRLILMSEDMPYYHPSLSNSDRLKIFQDTAKEMGLHHEYPIHHDHKPDIDEKEFKMPKGERFKVTIPEHSNVKMGLPQQSSKQSQAPTTNVKPQPTSQPKPSVDMHRMGYGGYLLPKHSKKYIDIE